jgi:hypothetical protein
MTRRREEIVAPWVWWATFRLAVGAGVGIRKAYEFACEARAELFL